MLKKVVRFYGSMFSTLQTKIYFILSKPNSVEWCFFFKLICYLPQQFYYIFHHNSSFKLFLYYFIFPVITIVLNIFLFYCPKNRKTTKSIVFHGSMNSIYNSTNGTLAHFSSTAPMGYTHS